jgi:DNA polymerase-3 subunit epsilon
MPPTFKCKNDTAIDFETATAFHPCSVGIVTVENGCNSEFVSLIKPPNNVFSLWIQVQFIQGIRWMQKLFSQYFLKSKTTTGSSCSRSQWSFDRTCYLNQWRWLKLWRFESVCAMRCTVKIYKAKGLKPTKLIVAEQWKFNWIIMKRCQMLVLVT